MTPLIYLAMASVSGTGSGKTDLVLRSLQLAGILADIAVIYFLRRHRLLQVVIGLAAGAVVAFYVVRGQWQTGKLGRAALVPSAPASCQARQDDFSTLAALGEEPQDLGYPVHTLDRLAVRSLLIQSSFDELDTLLTAYGDSARRDFRFEYRLFDAFGAFSIAMPELEPFVGDWVKARPASANALLVRATYYAAAGWHARGTDTFRNTAFRSAVSAQSNFTRAIADVDAALRLSPCSVAAYLTLMDIAPYYGDTATSRAAMIQALRIQPYSFLAREHHMLNLRPRWGGSYESMEKLATETDSLVGGNPRLKALHGFADWDRGDRAEREKDTDQAAELYDRALTSGDFWRFRLERAQFFHRQRRYTEALADLERAKIQRPQSPQLLDYLSSTKYALGREADEVEQVHLFTDAVGYEALAAELDPLDEDYKESLEFYRKNIPEFVHESGG